jgi:hypothetical protein
MLASLLIATFCGRSSVLCAQGGKRLCRQTFPHLHKILGTSVQPDNSITKAEEIGMWSEDLSVIDVLRHSVGAGLRSSLEGTVRADLPSDHATLLAELELAIEFNRVPGSTEAQRR